MRYYGWRDAPSSGPGRASVCLTSFWFIIGLIRILRFLAAIAVLTVCVVLMHWWRRKGTGLGQ